MNQLFFNYLNEYAENPDPQFAVMLKGKWGCGKTYFIKQWLKEYNSIIPNDDDAINLKPIYISLYGMSSIKDIETALDREVNPFFYSKTGKLLVGVGKLIGKIVFRTDFDFTKDGKEDASFSGSLDSLSLFKSSNEDIIKGVKFLVFDDIERCQIDIKTLLGFINQFVEHLNCHVVVIGDENHLDQKEKSILDDFKEKTVGREFEIKADIEMAIDSFLGESYISDYLKTERKHIIECFSVSKSDNLRLLRLSLMDFNAQLSKIETINLESCNNFLHNLLTSFIAVYAEINSNNRKAILKNFNHTYGIDEENKKVISALHKKYREISKSNNCPVFYEDYVERIVEHIKTGSSLIDFINDNLNTQNKEISFIDKISHFWSLSNDEFYSLYDDIIKALKTNNFESTNEIGLLIGYLSYFDVVGIKKLDAKDLSVTLQIIHNLYKSKETIEGLTDLHKSIIKGYNYVRATNSDQKLSEEIISILNSYYEEMKVSLPDSMQIVLRNLSDTNVDKLYELDTKPYPDGSGAYNLHSVLKDENCDDLFYRICSLSNKGKIEFYHFLIDHYHIKYNITNLDDRYKADFEVLSSLKKRIDIKLSDSVGVDHYAYKLISNALEESIKRSQGDTDVLE